MSIPISASYSLLGEQTGAILTELDLSANTLTELCEAGTIA